MVKQETIKKQGRVIEALPDLAFKVKLQDGDIIQAKLAGKLRRYRIKILPGDWVAVELSPYDKARGRITWRNKA